MPMTNRILASWIGKVRSDIYFEREERSVTFITLLHPKTDKDRMDELKLNRFIYPLDDEWILKFNCLIEKGNKFKVWSRYKKHLAYEYVSKELQEKVYKGKVKELRNKIVCGFMKGKINIPMVIINISMKYLPCPIVIFREFYIKWSPKPELIKAPSLSLTSMDIKWKSMCLDLSQGKTPGELLGDEEWIDR